MRPCWKASMMGSDQPEFDEAWLSEIGRRIDEVDAMIAEDQAARRM